MTAKKILIAGASSGIGREIACIYAGLGHTVSITGRNFKNMEAISQQYPDRILYATGDVRAEDRLSPIRQLIDKMNGIDLFIYNAGIGPLSAEFDREQEKNITATSVTGFVDITSFIFEYFIRQGSGHIALTTSIAALRGNAWSPAYSASKAFMSIYAEGLRLKVYKLSLPVHITELRPGFVNTKPSIGNRRFWVAPVHKAALQMVNAIDRKKNLAHITARWKFISPILRIMPYSLLKRLA